MNIAILLSGGTGSRLGSDIPKQYIKVEGKCVITYSLAQLLAHEAIDRVQIVASEQWLDVILEEVKGLGYHPQALKDEGRLGLSTPGQNRQLSIYHALKDIEDIASEDSLVFIHDAARPFLTEDMIATYLEAANGHDGVLPVLPMKDTVYLSKDGKSVSELLNRSQIYAGQAPEVFVYGKYLAANDALMPDKILEVNGSTEPAIMAGMDVVMTPGDERNFKITTKNDLKRMQQLLL